MGLSKEYEKYNEMSEFEFKKHIISVLSNDFVISEEWNGIHLSGSNVRIDAVMRPKNTDLWMNKKIVFGIEFKSPSKLIGFGKQLEFIKQAIDYSNTKFDRLGHIPILICPMIFFDEAYSNDNSNTFMRKLLNKFNIGEIGYTHRGLSIIFAESEFIWTTKEGVCSGKRDKLITKFGSQ